MEIIFRKPTKAEKAEMHTKPTQGCGVSEFEWYYDREETCLLIEDEATVMLGGGSVSFGAGDYVVFHKGLSFVWKVTQSVKKYYVAAMCLARKAIPISHDGIIYNDDNIGALLEQRAMAQKARRAGGRWFGEKDGGAKLSFCV